jgi:hypothetical protein
MHYCIRQNRYFQTLYVIIRNFQYKVKTHHKELKMEEKQQNQPEQKSIALLIFLGLMVLVTLGMILKMAGLF